MAFKSLFKKRGKFLPNRLVLETDEQRASVTEKPRGVGAERGAPDSRNAEGESWIRTKTRTLQTFLVLNEDSDCAGKKDTTNTTWSTKTTNTAGTTNATNTAGGTNTAHTAGGTNAANTAGGTNTANTAGGTNPANTAGSTNPANTAGSTNPANTARSTNAANTAGSTNPANTAGSTNPANTAGSTNPANTAGGTNPANTAGGTNAANTAGGTNPANTAGSTNAANTAWSTKTTNTVGSTNTANTAGGTNTANTAGGTNAANTARGTNAANTAGGTNTANTAGGTNAANTAGGTNAANTEGGTNAANTAGGTNAANTEGGTNAANTAGGTNAANTAGGTNAANTAGGTNAANTEGGTNAANTAGGTNAANTAGGTNAANTAGSTNAANTAGSTNIANLSVNTVNTTNTASNTDTVNMAWPNFGSLGASSDQDHKEANVDTERLVCIYHCDDENDIQWLAKHLHLQHSCQQTRLVTCLPLPLATQQDLKVMLTSSSLNILWYSKHKHESNQKQDGQSEPKSLESNQECVFNAAQNSPQDSKSGCMSISYTRIQVIENFLQLCIDTKGSQEISNAIDPKETKKPIGIFSRSADGGKWLETLPLQDSNGQTKTFRHIDISGLDNMKIKEEISRCSYCILHVTKEHIEDEGLLSQFNNKALIVMDDVEHTRSPEPISTLKKRPEGQISNVPPFAKGEKTDHWAQFNEEESQKSEHQLSTLETSISNKDKIIEEEQISAEKYQKMRPPYTVGIFSRSTPRDYEWIQALFRSEHFRDHVQAVNSCQISNKGFQRFLEDVSECTVGILYHTKQRGRINITDVTDSLYDRELQIMSDFLGKENVFVLVDDLDESGPEEKSKILGNQPSIQRYAGDLLLISQREKENEKRLQRKLYRINALG